MLRPATTADMPGLYALVEEMHDRSGYAKRGIELSPTLVRSRLMEGIRKNGGSHAGSTLLNVIDKGGVQAFMLRPAPAGLRHRHRARSGGRDAVLVAQGSEDFRRIAGQSLCRMGRPERAREGHLPVVDRHCGRGRSEARRAIPAPGIPALRRNLEEGA
jgi:hypothetical protein